MLAAEIGVSQGKILEWVNRADLYRISGISEEYSDLLEAAGVDTVVELSTRNPENLYEKLSETNTTSELVRQLPGKNQIVNWVRQAKELPRVVTY
jgi:predicted flap endonuclease-1-like 5' DNA nuclease